jgi:hypothetical protein
MQRKSSFVVIQVEMDPVDIKLDLTFWQSFRYYLYYVFSFIYIFLRQYSVSVNTPKSHMCKMKVFDNGINLDKYDVLIPYENVILVSKNSKYNTITCLAKIEEGRLELADNVTHIRIFNDNPDKLYRDIVNNMYYHLKYHKDKINFNILGYDSVKRLSHKKNN